MKRLAARLSPALTALVALSACGPIARPAAAAEPVALPAALRGPSLFARQNLLAWCFVPFDAKKRGPRERVEMLQRLGITRVAYDWRKEHVPQWDEELDGYARAGIELVAFWGYSDEALELIKRHHLHTQFWVMMPGKAHEADQEAMLDAAARYVESVAVKAREAGCSVALYNHGGWPGEPENQIPVIERLRAKGIDNVGICYNLHHAHHRLTDLPALLAKMRPYLWCLDLNGMKSEGAKILPLGQGDDDLGILKTVVASGYRGPIGILNHRDIDAEQGLRENLEGLQKLLAQLGDQAALATYR